MAGPVRRDPADPYTYLLPQLSHPVPIPGRAALLVVDMQYLDASPDHGWGRKLRDQGVFHLAEAFFERLATTVIPNIKRLQAACRERGVEVVFVRIETQKPDLLDASLPYRLMGFNSPRGSLESQILEELGPLPGEVVLAKASTGAFATSSLDRVLRNLGMEMVVVAGVNTDACVEMTCKEAADRGYWVTVVEDACAALGGSVRHQQAIGRLCYGVIESTTTAELLAAWENPRQT